MPYSPPSLCTGGCGTLVYSGGRCPTCKSNARREADEKRPTSNQRGYNTAWQNVRAAYLRAHPLCECSECTNLPAWARPAATDVDHIDGLGPHGPQGHNWDNLQALTHAHHSRKTARHDRGFGHHPKG